MQQAFSIQEIEIVNIGAYKAPFAMSFADLDGLGLFYGGNGSGKTTLLEAASLLGHLPCLPVIDADGGGHPSLLARMVDAPDLSPRAWWSSIPSGAARDSWMLDVIDEIPKQNLGLVRFKVWHGVETEFYVAVRNVRTSGRPTLTPLLSRDAHPSGAAADDLSLEDNLVILQRSRSGSFDRLLRELFVGRTFLVDGEHVHGTVLQERRGIDPVPGMRSLRVAYVNTDLNDFGRGNDLRESPKQLTESFDEQVRRRIHVSFEQGTYVHLERLRECMALIIPDRSDLFSDAHALGDGLRVNTFEITDGHLEFTAKRGDDTYEPQFLSAGENEILFLLLMCLHVRTSEEKNSYGILLLDEPDLHLANDARVEFFRVLREQAGVDTQLLIASHSNASMTALGGFGGVKQANHVRVIHAYRSASQDIRARAGYDPRYLGRLYQRRSHRLTELRMFFESALSPHYGDTLARSIYRFESWVLTGLCLVMAFAAGLAVLNDVGDVLNVIPFSLVEKVHHLVKAVYVVGVVAMLFVLAQRGAISVERWLARRRGDEFGARPWATFAIVNVAAALISIATSALVVWLGNFG